MFVPFGVARSATRAMIRQRCRRPRVLAVAALIATGLSGCIQATVPLAGPDPADPGAKIQAVSYRSTIAPYTSLRPAAPTGWKEQNQSVAPKQGKSE